MLPIISVELLTILEPCTERADFQTYLGSTITKKGVGQKLVPDFSVG